MSAGTPAYAQIEFLERECADLEARVEELTLAYRTLRGTLANVGQSDHEITAAAERALTAFPFDPEACK